MHVIKDLIALYDWLIPVGILLVSLLLGITAEKIVSNQLKKLQEKPSGLRQLENTVLDTIHGLPLIWFFLLGIHFALFKFHIGWEYFVEGQKTILIIFMFSLIVILARVAGSMVSHMSKQLGTALHSTSIFENITRLSIYVIGLLAILQTMGISVLPVLTALGVGGLAVSLALNDTLANFFSGIHILVSRQIRPGDYIRMDTNQEGTVLDISLRNTTIRQLNNNVVIIPNLKLSTSIVTNFDKMDSKMLVPIPITLKRDESSDLEKLEKVTLEVAKEVQTQVETGVTNFTPYFRYSTYGDATVEFTVYLKAKNYNGQFLLKHEFIKRLKLRLDAEKITHMAIPANLLNPDSVTTHPVP